MKNYRFFSLILLMAHLIPFASVTAGGLQLDDYIHNIHIESTHTQLGDFADIQIPRNVTFQGERWDKILKRGDEVSIQLGYEGYAPNQEFKGKISHISPEIPITIHCEDIQDFKTRTINKSYQSVNLQEVTRLLAGDMPFVARDIDLGKFLIKNATPALVFQKLREDYGLASYIQNGTLYVGAKYANNNIITHTFNAWCRGSNLQYVLKEDVKIHVKCVSTILETNKKIEAEAGEEGGESRTYPFVGITSKAELQKLANEQLAKISLDGYQGTLLTLGNPYVKHGDKVIIVDKEFEGLRTSKYFTDKIVVSYSKSNGYKRELTLGEKAGPV